MEYLCIQLQPERMSNFDLSLKHDLPNLLITKASHNFDAVCDGIEYSEEEGFLNFIFLGSQLREFWKYAKVYLSNTEVNRNEILNSAIVTFHPDYNDYFLLSHFDKNIELDEFQ